MYMLIALKQSCMHGAIAGKKNKLSISIGKTKKAVFLFVAPRHRDPSMMSDFTLPLFFFSRKRRGMLGAYFPAINSISGISGYWVKNLRRGESRFSVGLLAQRYLLAVPSKDEEKNLLISF